MATEEQNTSKLLESTGFDALYPMSLPRMGQAIIINNVATEMPGSLADVEALQAAYKDVGFDVQSYSDCTTEEMMSLKQELMTEESHQDHNVLAIHIICHGSNSTDVLDVNKHKAFTVQELADDLDRVENLKNKPKLLMIQKCRGEVDPQRLDGETVPGLPGNKDFFFGYCCITGFGSTVETQSGSVYLQSFAKHMRDEYMKKSYSDIFEMVKESVEAQTTLTDKVLMEMAGEISSRDMQNIAIGFLDIKTSVVKSVVDAANRNQKMMNYELLQIWRNKRPENNRAKLADILFQAAEKDGVVNSYDVLKILAVEKGAVRQFSGERNNFTKFLHFSEYYGKHLVKSEVDPGEIREIENEDKEVDDQSSVIEKLTQEITKLREEETKKIDQLKHEKQKLEIAANNSAKQLAAEKAKYQKYAEKIRADKERTEREKDAEKERVMKLENDLKMSSREIQNLKEDKVRYEGFYEKELQTLQHQKERESKTMQKLTEENRQLTELSASQSLRLEEYEKTLVRLKEEMIQFRETETQKMKELEEEKQTLEAAAKYSTEQLERLKAEKVKNEDSFEKEIQKMKAEKENAERQRDVEKERIFKLESDAKKYNQEIQNLKEEKENMEKSEKYSTEQVKALTDEKVKQQQQFEEEMYKITADKEKSEKQKDVEIEKVRELEKNLDSCNKALQNLKEEKAKYEKYYENEIEKIRADREKAEKLKEAEVERVRKLESDLKLSNEEIQSLKIDQRHNQDCHEKEIEKMRNAQKEQERRFEEEKEQLKEQEEINILKERFSMGHDYEEKLERLRKKIRELGDEINELEEQKHALEETAKYAAGALAAVCKKCDGQNKEADEIQQLQNQIANMMELSLADKRRVEKMRDAHKEQERRFEKEIEKMKEQEENKRLKEQFVMVQDYEQKLERLREEITKLKKTENTKIKELEQDIENLREKLYELKLLFTHDTDFIGWSRGFTIMPQSGDVVMTGKEEVDDPTFLFMFSLKGGKLRVTKRMSLSCGHKLAAFMSSLIIDGRDQLVVFCTGCDELKLLDLPTGKWNTAFRGFKPGALCSGGNGTIYVQSQRDKAILELDCTNPAFNEPINTLHTHLAAMSICYIPPPIKNLAISDYYTSKMVALSVERDEIIWELQREKGGIYNSNNKVVGDRTGLLFHPELNVLLVADGFNKRVLIVDPATGGLIQTIDLPEMDAIGGLALYKNKLVMLHLKDTWKISTVDFNLI